MMKIAIYAGFRELISKEGIYGAFKTARDLGYDAAELLFTTSEGDCVTNESEEYERAVRDFGIPVACISCYTDVVTKDEPYRVDPSSVYAVKKCIDLAVRIGCRFVHHTLVTSLCRARDDYAEIIPIACEAATEIASYARARDIDILYEPQGMLFNGLLGYSEFFDTVRSNCDNVGVCLDVGNTLWVDENCYALAEKYAPYVKHVHLKDYVLSSDNRAYLTAGGKSINEVMLGTGIIDLNRVFNVLTNTGFDGYFSIEDNSSNNYELIARNAKAIIK